jgi:hypothetical protein
MIVIVHKAFMRLPIGQQFHRRGCAIPNADGTSRLAAFDTTLSAAGFELLYPTDGTQVHDQGAYP